VSGRRGARGRWATLAGARACETAGFRIPGDGMPRAYDRGEMNRLKIVAIVYVVKTLLVGIAWLMVPDLPQRAMTKARATWTAVSGRP
jgi:hypothetical protein